MINRLSNDRLLIIIALLICLSACAGMGSSKQLDSLEMSLNEFRKSLRWGYFEQASSYIGVKNYTKPLRDRSYLKNIRITSFEYGSQQLSDDQTLADVTALISYYDVNHGTVNDIVEHQIWWYDTASGRWLLDGDIPDFSTVR